MRRRVVPTDSTAQNVSVLSTRGCAWHVVEGQVLGDKIKPLGDRVVLEAEEREETTRSGIVLPDTAKEKPQEGRIVAAGPGRRLDSGELVPLEVKVGDKVLYAKYAGTEVKLDGKEYLIVREADILAVMD